MSNNKKDSGKFRRNDPWNPVDESAASDGDIQRVHEELVHDKESPREGFSAIPIFLVFLVSGLVVFSGIYMVLRSDDFDPLGFVETRTRARDSWSGEAGVAAPAVDPVLQAGQMVYMQTCAACHQQNGQGLAGAFPPLDGTRWSEGNKERLIRVVMHGIMGPIEVKGESYNGVMPNFALGDEDIASVLTYVRQAWSNSAGPVTIAEVAQVRADVGQRSPWTAEELVQQFPLEDPEQLQQQLEQAGETDSASDESAETNP